MGSLSQENIDKLCMTGVYIASPDDFKCPANRDPFWCRNWTFRVRQDRNGDYCMDDTFWSSTPNSISLMDSNFDKFTLLFDLNDVEKYHGQKIYDYDENDYWIVPMDSGGRGDPTIFVKKGARPVKEKVVKRLEYEIARLKDDLKWKERDLKAVLMDEKDLRWV